MRKQSKKVAAAKAKPAAKTGRVAEAAAGAHGGNGGHARGGNGGSQLFTRMASTAAHYAGKPITFLTAVGIVLAWAVSGPFFGFSDTWQLVINTSTTIVTFLMVFLIQNTQNRDALAVQLKLAELIIAAQGAKNKIATIEDLSEEELEELHEGYRKQAEETLAHLKRKRGDELKRAS
jgi:low affinity Fe/Cu permease